MSAPLAGRLASERDEAEMILARATEYRDSVALVLVDAQTANMAAALDLERAKAARAALQPWDDGLLAADAAIVGATVALDVTGAALAPLHLQQQAAATAHERAVAMARACAVAQERERRIATMLPLAATARAALVDLSVLLAEHWPGISQRDATMIPAGRGKALATFPGPHDAERKKAARMLADVASIEKHLEAGRRQLESVFPSAPVD